MSRLVEVVPDAYAQAEIEAEACPECHARPARPCTYWRGPLARGTYHSLRVQAAQAAAARALSPP